MRSRASDKLKGIRQLPLHLMLIPGIILMSVGYSVNSTTGAYAGDLAGLPNMIRGLVIAITVVPMIVSILTWAIYKYGYNITPEFRAKMIAELEQRRATIAEDTEQ